MIVCLLLFQLLLFFAFSSFNLSDLLLHSFSGTSLDILAVGHQWYWQFSIELAFNRFSSSFFPLNLSLDSNSLLDLGDSVSEGSLDILYVHRLLSVKYGSLYL